jgi:hypothetical protein
VLWTHFHHSSLSCPLGSFQLPWTTAKHRTDDSAFFWSSQYEARRNDTEKAEPSLIDANGRVSSYGAYSSIIRAVNIFPLFGVTWIKYESRLLTEE